MTNFGIEDATPIDDISDLKLPWVKTRDQLNEVEAESILEAYSKYFSKAKNPRRWFSEAFLKQAHYDMFGKVWNWAGLYYRGSIRNIGIASYLIPIQVRELCQDVVYWLENESQFSFIEQSVRIHHRLTKIHPFTNGNGRHARFIADLYLHSVGLKRPSWPENSFSLGHDERKEYICAIKKADFGDYHSLIELTKRFGAME